MRLRARRRASGRRAERTRDRDPPGTSPWRWDIGRRPPSAGRRPV